jgi:hypothetical protein
MKGDYFTSQESKSCKTYSFRIKAGKLESIFLVYRQKTLANFGGAVVVVLVWWLDLQLSVQSVPITTKNVSSNTAQCEVC